MNKKKIIIIDDDREFCGEITEILTAFQYQVMAFTNPAAGLKSLTTDKYDLLLLDLKMPRVSGFDILKHVKEQKIKLPVLVITGNPLSSNIVEGSRDTDASERQIIKTAEGVINKPFNIPDLLTRIEKILNRPVEKNK
ncbi:MAG: response regulator [Candidatus Margulisiibacteriota bacterium]